MTGSSTERFAGSQSLADLCWCARSATTMRNLTVLLHPSQVLKARPAAPLLR
jgi:hypothetical protein